MTDTETLAPPTAALLVEVAFKGNRKEFFLWQVAPAPRLGLPVIVDADRGEDLGTVNATGELAEKRKAGTTHGKAAPDALRHVLRAASPEEVARGSALRADEENVRRRAIEKVRAQGLEMKVSDTEWQWDKKKLTIYFTAEQRVDFRNLVRQLEGLFGTRVQMWHIGVRDEARRLDGIGRCARQFCSASWLPELRPVKSSVAKDQRLSTLNPAQISGTCGRLMCCLRYEHEFYVQQRKRFPKEGKILTTALGEEKVVSNDIFREQVTLRTATGEARTIPLGQLNRELGTEILMATSEFAVVADDEDRDDEPLVEIQRPPRREPPRAKPSPSSQAAKPPAKPSEKPPVEPATEVTAVTPTAEGGDGTRRRRRRGRRGGRRGRGEGGAPPGATPGTPPDAPPPSTGG
jgi:cell fate regulator YaaT (PSP1 superfamily)